MVADHVNVESIAVGTDKAHRWSSDGSGTFNIEIMSSLPTGISTHGTRIDMHLKESCKEFCTVDKIQSIIKHYSNFVSFPIKLNDKVINR